MSTAGDSFQSHTDELIQIWNGNSALRRVAGRWTSADSVGDFYADLAVDFENGYLTPWSVYFNWTRYNEIDSEILSRIYASASTPLRADINNLRSHLQSKIGLTFGQIFSGDLEEYPNNPGEPLEPDPPLTCNLCEETAQEVEVCPVGASLPSAPSAQSSAQPAERAEGPWPSSGSGTA